MDPLDSAIAQFNARAEREGWGQFCDPHAGFVMAECDDLVRLWYRLATKGRLPPREAFTPRTLKPYLPRLVLVEQVEDARMRFRLIGTMITKTLNERTGQFFDDAAATPAQTARWTASMQLVFAAGRPLRFFMRGESAVTGELLCLPLADETGVPRYVLGYGCYDPLRDWTPLSSRIPELMSLAGS